MRTVDVRRTKSNLRLHSAAKIVLVLHTTVALLTPNLKPALSRSRKRILADVQINGLSSDYIVWCSIAHMLPKFLEFRAIEYQQYLPSFDGNRQSHLVGQIQLYALMHEICPITWRTFLANLADVPLLCPLVLGRCRQLYTPCRRILCL